MLRWEVWSIVSDEMVCYIRRYGDIFFLLILSVDMYSDSLIQQRMMPPIHDSHGYNVFIIKSLKSKEYVPVIKRMGEHGMRASLLFDGNPNIQKHKTMNHVITLV